MFFKQSFSHLLQVCRSSLYSFQHKRPHVLNDVYVRTLERPVNFKLLSLLLFSSFFFITLAVHVLGIVILLENEVVTNKSPSNGHSFVDDYLLVYRF